MNTDDLLFTPLGGVGQIGMNVNLYHLNGKWIIIDFGAGFADDNMPGIDMIVADISFIKKNRKNLLGIVLTHAHEDHIGGIQYLWNDLQCPIYATKFTAALLQAKLKEYPFRINITEIDITKKLNLGPFTLEFINLTHSIPEMNAIALHTEKGIVVHTGDWKLDDNPIIGPVSNTQRLKELGDEGVLALVCDSTNIFTKNKSGSESDLEKSIFNIIKNCNQKVAVSLFASNIARIYTIVNIATKLGRKVAILGKSLIRIIQAAQDSGYLQDIPEFININQANKLPNDQVLLLCTGCQGEELAATAKLANNSHPFTKLDNGDTIIFSSKIIPGNEKRIYSVFNKFVNMGVNVITEFMEHVHVSGHPSKSEVSTMYSLVRPKLSIPVHGEYIHMHEHAKVAKQCNVEKAIIVHPGDVISLTKKQKINSVKAGYFGVDGNFLHHPKGNVISMRKKMRDAGIIIITLVLNNKKELLKEPRIFAPGVLDHSNSQAILKKVSSKISSELYSRKINNIRQYVENTVFNALKYDIKNKPFIEVQLEYIN
ncbi:metallo-beta-lactamase superfamily protein [Ehrlichia chaffeensis str. Liberty]|uniref:Metallo-beta-lactamase family, beta-CASP subfamily n=1 Tax=Ehrlichia chaffeensis (strain ATCC CRL-10679 / Arkansas) TaxID=205920 RepID=Q2GFN0_EHRCR|nr:ribonuclease J [Ehrlichia chaffeensis]ABD45297.1 metallo-beta-lactamase family, beta-CASP subfamily [Ehrlichia chaffeensis str. Arkansas]AHX05282.1 metallo-beta-lactamase superfamily protein [Ehrlichia chaffeensis str. Jax]AHX06270.1 metallo-beta-lactamase superfamily protein [Ehrlichia chaffeensis str. Liberty]AHX07714.1 metallo-beta-lactamase superfamily protein [Ehrlichia chaffeensis str. Osceola]AHX08457.1 metallo-beta-lactamase superfamily protein [Ehrlichia chaffeensis str. Saint Vinc